MFKHEVYISLDAFWSQFLYFETILILKYKKEVKRSHVFRPLLFDIDFSDLCKDFSLFYLNFGLISKTN